MLATNGYNSAISLTRLFVTESSSSLCDSSVTSSLCLLHSEHLSFSCRSSEVTELQSVPITQPPVEEQRCPETPPLLLLCGCRSPGQISVIAALRSALQPNAQVHRYCGQGQNRMWSTSLPEGLCFWTVDTESSADVEEERGRVWFGIKKWRC